MMEQTPPPPIADLLCKDAIAFDIETVANREILDMPGVMPDFKAPSNVKDPIKIKAKIKEKQEKFISGAALDPNYGKIIVACLKNDSVEHVFSGDNESILLTGVWDALKDWRELVGYNSKSFDLPYLIRRSWYHGIKPTIKYDLLPFRTVSHYDLRLILSHGNKTAAGKLSAYIRLKFGRDIEGAGSEVQGQYEAGLIKEIAEHCVSDVTETWALFKSMSGYYF